MSLENTGEIVFIEVSKPSKKEKYIYTYVYIEAQSDGKRREERGERRWMLFFTLILQEVSHVLSLTYHNDRWSLKSIGGKIDTGLIMKDPHGNNTSLFKF